MEHKRKLSKGILLLIILVLLVVLGISILYFTTNKSSSCANAGERSTSNFDMTTGKTNPNIETRECCTGLVKIADKQPLTNINSDVCGYTEGVAYNLCSPCGNGNCDSLYEDRCNCPEDCK